MTNRSRTNFLFLFLGLTFSTGRLSAQATSVDSIYARAQRMVSDGDAASGRALADSMVRAGRRGSPAHAEALFWRATLAPSVSLAEQDYRQLLVEYPLYGRTGDVLLRLAQLELFRGNREAAMVHLRRIQMEHPEFGNQAAASYWIGRALFEKNDTAGGCSAIASAKRLVKADDVELKNQIDYQDQQCGGVAVNSRKDSAAPDRRPGFSVQVAAYARESQAIALAGKLLSRGFAARVDGLSAPYRVRIGTHRTADEAATAQQRLRKSGIAGFVVKVD